MPIFVLATRGVIGYICQLQSLTLAGVARHAQGLRVLYIFKHYLASSVFG